MKPKDLTLLLHPLFLSNLCLLLLNDLSWKYEYHNWLTGKLSDFSGLFVFAVVLFSFFPKKKAVTVFILVFFCWWKSPLSSGFLAAYNSTFSFPLYRQQDYTDLIAFLVLPLAWRLTPFVYPSTKTVVRRILINLVLMVSLFSFCYTSMVSRQLAGTRLRDNEVLFNQTYWTKYSRKEVLQLLLMPGMEYREESVKLYPFNDGDYFQRVQIAHDSVAWIPIPNTNDSALFARSQPPRRFYVIPYHVFANDTIFNLEVAINEHDGKSRKKNTSVTVESFFAKKGLYGHTYYGKKLRNLEKHFRQLLKK